MGHDHSPGQASTLGQGAAPLERVLRSLRQVRRRAKFQLVVQRSTLLFAGIAAGVVLLALLDYFLKFPVLLRCFHLLAAGGLLAWIGLRLLRPAFAFAPSLTDLALRIERQHSARDAGLAGLLASGVDFARRAEENERGGQAISADEATLFGLVGTQAAERYAAFARTAKLFHRGLLIRGLAATGLALAVVAGSWAAFPQLTSIGLLRVTTPWVDVEWPKRTQIRYGDMPRAFAIGGAVPIRAVLTQTDQAPGKTNVILFYRIIDPSGVAGPRQKQFMTPQGRMGEAPAAPGEQPVTGELFEQLLDATLLPTVASISTQAGAALANDNQDGAERTAAAAADELALVYKLEYWLETKDDATPPATLLLVAPPSVLAAGASIQPPAYASRLRAASATPVTSTSKATASSAWFLTGEADVSPGGPLRGTIGPVLAGSRVVLTLQLNKPMGLPPGAGSPLERFLPGFVSLADARLTSVGATQGMNARSSRWQLSFTATESVRSPILLTDEYGIASADDAAFRLEVLADRPPAAAILEPAQDEAVLATALIPVEAEGRDDVGISSIELVQQLTKVPTESAGAAPEPVGEANVLVRETADAPNVSSHVDSQGEFAGPQEPLTQLAAKCQIDLAPLSLLPGDEVWLIARATDLMMEAKGEPGVESSKRRLRVIAESDLIEQLQAELGGVREAAKRAEAEQSGLSSQREQARATGEAASQQLTRQQALGDRIAPMSDAVSRLAARLERNRLENEGLQGLLKNAAELAAEAKLGSDAAADALDRLATSGAAERGTDERVQAQAQALATAQQGVEEALSELASLLDRGQDNWVVRRAVEKMIVQQDQLAQRAAAASAELQGKKQSELTPLEKAALERLSKEQADLAARSRAAVGSMAQRAAQLKTNDPSQAQGMEAAAATALKERLSENQQQAAEDIAKNNAANAQRAQQQASQTLKKMLKELDKSQQRKDEALKRVLASVIESIEKLISQQQAQLARLAEVAAASKPATPLAEGMMALHANTLGTQATVKQQVKDGAAVLIDLLASAGEAQTAAIVALRATPADTPEADMSERVSLSRLTSALEKARELEDTVEEREEDRKLEELKAMYTQCAELQAALNADTLTLLDRALSRRENRQAEQFGNRQQELKQQLSDIRSTTQELNEAALFVYAHTRYDSAAGDAAAILAKATVNASVQRHQSTALRVLQSMVAALEEAQRQKTDEFKEDEQASEGQGGGQGGKPPMVPPIAELKLLRAMQAEAADRTRALEKATDEQAPAELAATAALQRALLDNANTLLEKLKQQEQEEADEKPGPKERN